MFTYRASLVHIACRGVSVAGCRRLGEKPVGRKTFGRQKPKQFASQRSTLVRNSVVRATIKVNGMGNPRFWGAVAP